MPSVLVPVFEPNRERPPPVPPVLAGLFVPLEKKPDPKVVPVAGCCCCWVLLPSEKLSGAPNDVPVLVVPAVLPNAVVGPAPKLTVGVETGLEKLKVEVLLVGPPAKPTTS